MAENHGAVNPYDLATLSLLNGGYGFGGGIGVGRGGYYGPGVTSATWGSDTVLDRDVVANREFGAFQFNQVQRDIANDRTTARFDALQAQITANAAAAAECCCETKLGIAELKAEIKAAQSANAQLFLEQDARMSAAKIAGLETQLAIKEATEHRHRG